MTEPTQSLTDFLNEFRNKEQLVDVQEIAIPLEMFINLIHKLLSTGIDFKRISILIGRCLLIADEAHTKGFVSKEQMDFLLNQFHLTFDIHGQKLPQFKPEPFFQLISHPLYVGDDDE